jgi:hypothetical protein
LDVATAPRPFRLSVLFFSDLIEKKQDPKMNRSYKAVSYGNDVDESLFGNPARKTRSAIPANATVITAGDINAMRQRSILRSPADEMRERAMREAALEEKQKISRLRKEKMLQMEIDAKNKVRTDLYCFIFLTFVHLIWTYFFNEISL